MTKRAEIRGHVLANLDHYLGEFDKQFAAQGGKVVYLTSADEAADYIDQLGRERDWGLAEGPDGIRQWIDRVEPRVDEYLRAEAAPAPAGLAGGEGKLAIARAAFLVAEAGAICLAGAGAAGPRVQVVVAGLENVLPRMRDVAVFLPLLAEGDVRFLTGPRRAGELDGPEELHLLVVDGGRTELLADARKRELLRCVRCGACLPGRATAAVCPVDIDVESLPTLLREEVPAEVGGWKFRLWGYVMQRPRLYEFAGGILRAFWREEWGLPAPPAKTFRQAWREGRK
jgi:L-lactate utilization protein LutB